MEITLTDNLKAFRKDKGNTQEELASFLGISVQAVSKWERGEGYPDITLLHRIAAFYNKSVDDLLGVGEIAKQERIEHIMNRFSENATIGETAANVALMKEAIKELPNNHHIIKFLMHALSSDEDKDAGRDYRGEIIELGDRLLKESTDNEIRNSVIQLLCYTYCSMDELNKAKEYALMLPDMNLTRNILLNAVFKGKELLVHTQYNLQELTDVIFLTIRWMITAKTYTAIEKIRAYQKALDFYGLIFDDGDYGFYHCRLMEIYREMSRLYSETGDGENAISCLSLQADNAITCDTMQNHRYTAFLVDNTEYKVESTSKNFKESYCELTYINLSHHRFDFIRNDERFIKLKSKLEPYIK
ncbi:MAG: helix-turn-helix transcriptional regulator [Eubacteriales bacterium]